MLERNFLSPGDLGLTDLQHLSLVTVLGMLERGELEHEDDWRNPTKHNVFHMAPMIRRAECGTAACMCGWANIVSGGMAFTQIEVLRLARINPQIVDLFTAGMQDVTVAQAAHALRNFLTTGAPSWNQVLGRPEHRPSVWPIGAGVILDPTPGAAMAIQLISDMENA